MPIDPNIILQGRVPDLGAAIQQGFSVGQQFREQPFRNQLLEQQVAQGEQSQQLNEQSIAQNQLSIDNEEFKVIARGAAIGLSAFENGDIPGVVKAITDTITDEDDLRTELELLQKDPEVYRQRLQSIDSFAKQQKGGVSADQRGFERLIKDFTPDEQAQARRARAGIVAKAGSSAQERIAADEALKAQVVELESQLAESKAVGKATGESKSAPMIAKAKSTIATATTLARKEAEAKGEAFSDLRKAEAGLPGVKEVVGSLRSLSAIATHTKTGKVLNAASKELGFGSTKGGDARASYQATIDNQVLPLLKQTFGAAMTEGEGKRLADTLGDVDASPTEKMAQLEAFLESQERQIANLKREVSPQKQGGQLMIDANGNKAMVFPDGTFEEVK